MRVLLVTIWLALIFGNVHPNDAPRDFVTLGTANKIQKLPNGIEMFTFTARQHSYRIELKRQESEGSGYMYQGWVKTFNSHYSNRKIVAHGNTDSGYFIGAMELESSPFENNEFWFFTYPDIGSGPIFFTYKDYIGFQLGSLFICAKINYKNWDAILLIADSAVITASTKAEKKVSQKEFDEETRKRKKDDLIQYIRDHGAAHEGFDKIIQLGAISRGILGVGGDRYVYDMWQETLRGSLIPLSEGNSKIRAEDSFKKIDESIKKLSRDTKGTILLGQIAEGKRKIFKWKISPINYPWFPRKGYGIDFEEILMNNHKWIATGLADWDEEVKQYLGNLFGSQSDVKEKEFDKDSLVEELTYFAQMLQNKYEGVLGKNLKGYIISDTPESDGLPIERIETK